MRVANMALAAYLVISAEATSIKITRKLFNKKGRYKRDKTSFAFSESTPTTTLSGVIKSLIASPSLRNSGLEATSNEISTPRLSNSA